MPDAKAALKALTAEYADLNRRYRVLADIRRCEFAAALAAGLLANMVSLGNATFSVIAAVEHADALIAELEKKRVEFDESLGDA